MKRLVLTVATVSSVFLLGAGVPAAYADNFTFSFTNTLGDVSGTVTGEILDLTNNATSAAAEVIIESYPSVSELETELGPTPIDVTSWADQNVNSFTEIDGVVTSGEFNAYTAPVGYSELALNETGGLSWLCVTTDCTAVFTDGGIQADNIEPLAAPVPEPASIMLLGTGIVTLVGRRFRRRHQR